MYQSKDSIKTRKIFLPSDQSGYFLLGMPIMIYTYKIHDNIYVHIFETSFKSKILPYRSFYMNMEMCFLIWRPSFKKINISISLILSFL